MPNKEAKEKKLHRLLCLYDLGKTEPDPFFDFFIGEFYCEISQIVDKISKLVKQYYSEYEDAGFKFKNQEWVYVKFSKIIKEAADKLKNGVIVFRDNILRMEIAIPSIVDTYFYICDEYLNNIDADIILKDYNELWIYAFLKKNKQFLFLYKINPNELKKFLIYMKHTMQDKNPPTRQFIGICFYFLRGYFLYYNYCNNDGIKFEESVFIKYKEKLVIEDIDSEWGINSFLHLMNIVEEKKIEENFRNDAQYIIIGSGMKKS